jgi:UDPglucose 6-dehydrogenase
MNITVLGTGYVGLVTGVSLADIGHQLICVDLNKEKVKKMMVGISPFYEPGLEELMKKNINEGRLHFTTNLKEGLNSSEIIYITVGTPQNKDGSADLAFIEQVAIDIAQNVIKDAIVVTKSTVPVGTNELLKKIINANLKENVTIKVVSNPEFLREGSAIHDTFYGDRIVIGSEDDESAKIIESVYKPLGIPTYITDIRSAEMIKYASNAFLATKISFINEISNVCERVGANIEEVAKGIGMDTRIGNQFLNAGIGYGGSCFPKDTHALVQIAGNVHYEFKLLKSVIKVNECQQLKLVQKAQERFGSLKGKKIALLGLSFKPNTDDMREAPSIVISNKLVHLGASIIGYDPLSIENAKKSLPQEVNYTLSIEKALRNADMAFILTEWNEIKKLNLELVRSWMREPIVFDGRNCFTLGLVKEAGIEYYSIGRPAILKE